MYRRENVCLPVIRCGCVTRTVKYTVEAVPLVTGMSSIEDAAPGLSTRSAILVWSAGVPGARPSVLRAYLWFNASPGR
jgi:hypothetical protein